MTDIPDVLAPVAPVPNVGEEPVGDGREDFDFLFGTWRVANRKLADMLDPDCADWREFETIGTAQPILRGLGNVDSLVTPADGPFAGFAGFTLRLFDPEQRTWRIWWASTNRPGTLDTPMEGRFDSGIGIFHGTGEIGGRPVDVRFRWQHAGRTRARWEQDFSTDHGARWWTNWTMDFTRPRA